MIVADRQHAIILLALPGFVTNEIYTLKNGWTDCHCFDEIRKRFKIIIKNIFLLDYKSHFL